MCRFCRCVSWCSFWSRIDAVCVVLACMYVTACSPCLCSCICEKCCVLYVLVVTLLSLTFRRFQQNKTNSVVLVPKRAIPTERPHIVTTFLNLCHLEQTHSTYMEHGAWALWGCGHINYERPCVMVFLKFFKWLWTDFELCICCRAL
jgi:hypothetical protein